MPERGEVHRTVRQANAAALEALPFEDRQGGLLDEHDQGFPIVTPR